MALELGFKDVYPESDRVNYKYQRSLPIIPRALVEILYAISYESQNFLSSA